MDLWTRDHGLRGQDLENLRQICLFIIGIYYKQWFHIKRDHKLVDGSHHMLRQVQLVSNYFSAKVRAVVNHPELLLISLLTSTDEKDRHFAVKTSDRKSGRGPSLETPSLGSSRLLLSTLRLKS